MDDRQVKNSMDFGQFAPGVYAAADYGIPGVPQIRGDEAQIYVNGQQIPYSRNSVPLSFNGVEAMDIVKGPGTAVFGPQGNGPGGYVNFVSKQPYFDQDHYDFSATLGTWTSGHSYGNPQYTLDFGGPISDKLAYRISYLARYGDEYYVNAKDQTQDVYAALTYLATKNLKFEFWAQGFATRTNEDTGANRVTQNFIWNGGYVAGSTTPSTTGPNAYYGYDIYLPGDGNPAENFPSGADGAFVVVDPTKAHNVKLPAYDSLVGPNDTARSKLFQSQLKTTLDLGTDMSLVNLMYYSLEHSNKYETYGYDEWVPRNLNLQDRVEFHDKFNLGTIENNIITGIDLRYQYVRSGDDYSSEPFSYYDLSVPLSGIFYPGYTLENNTWGSGLEVAGHPGYSYQEMQDTTIHDYAAFIQDDVKVHEEPLLDPRLPRGRDPCQRRQSAARAAGREPRRRLRVPLRVHPLLHLLRVLLAARAHLLRPWRALQLLGVKDRPVVFHQPRLQADGHPVALCHLRRGRRHPRPDELRRHLRQQQGGGQRGLGHRQPLDPLRGGL